MDELCLQILNVYLFIEVAHMCLQEAYHHLGINM